MPLPPRRGVARGWLPVLAALLISLGAAVTFRAPRSPVPVSPPQAVAPPPAPARPGPRGLIAFVRSGDIWTVRADGTGARRIIRRGAAPCWSPDRRRVAFTRGGDVWVARADGGNQQRLTGFRDADPRDDETIVSWDPVADAVTFSRPIEYHFDRTSYAPPGAEPGLVIGAAIFDV